MNQTILGPKEVHEGTEIHHLHNFAIIDLTHFGFGRQPLDPFQRGFDGGAIGGCHFHRAIIFDIDFRARLFDDLADHFAAGADHVADLVDRNLDDFDARCIFAKLFAAVINRLAHLAQNVHAPTLGLIQRDFHDLFGDARDLDVHLQGCDAAFGSGNLEIHIAEVIFVAQNVGQHGKPFAFQNQTHRDTGDRLFDRHARIHQRERGTAHRCHRRRAIGFGDFGHNAQRIGELIFCWQHRMNGAPCQLAMADFAAARRAHAARFAHRIGREIIMQHEMLFLCANQAINELFVFAGAKRGHNEGLRFTTREQRRTVGAR